MRHRLGIRDQVVKRNAERNQPRFIEQRPCIQYAQPLKSGGATMLEKDKIRHVSKLARLTLSETELEEFSEVLSAVLENFQQIEKVETANVKPLVTPTDVAVALRADVVERTVTSESLLENAAEKSGRLFKVPPVVKS
jgi:aspartyl-tRNA(Asn)/glutamyl-tRNA(Gln) amidotransferase subunit C